VTRAPHDEWLWGFWYPAARSTQLRRGKLRSAELLGTALVLGRDAQGRAFALFDACPHRAMPLSCGGFDGRLVECSYHGWKFDPHTGQCREIPSLTGHESLRVERIHARHFPCEERDGYVWVFLPDPERPDEPVPPPPELPVFSESYTRTHLQAELPCTMDNGIIGLMDPAHGPFVHQAWWWRSRRSIRLKEKTFEPIPNGFRMVPHEPSPNSAPYKLLRLYGYPVTTTIEFRLPNMRLEQIRCGPYWFSSRATVTPIDRERCRIDFVAAWNLFRWVPFAVPLFRAFGKRFIEQDRRTMERQAAGVARQPRMMLIDDADRPAKWYFQLKARYLEAKRTGVEPPHPLPGRVTLRWRS
jgi:phenylpropionate dioxygenase-like ring-hydroxylating dioxygenase large terminal subunit